jgi:hypothetical protein
MTIREVIDKIALKPYKTHTCVTALCKGKFFGDCDNSVREKDWSRQGDVAGLTHARLRQSIELMYK